MHSLKQIGFIYFVYLFIYSGLEFTVTFLMFHKFGFTSIDQAKMFVTTGVVMAFLQGGVVRRLPAHLNKQSAVFGLYLIVPAFLLIGMAKDVKTVYAGMILFAVCKSRWLIHIIRFYHFNLLLSLTHWFDQLVYSDCIRCNLYDHIDIAIWQSWSKGHRVGHFSVAGRIGPCCWTHRCIDWYVKRYLFSDFALNLEYFSSNFPHFHSNAAFWGIGSSYTYITGGLLLLWPTLQLQYLKLAD